MIYKNIKKLTLVCLFVTSMTGTGQAVDRTTQDISQAYHQILQNFEQIRQQDASGQSSLMHQFFLQIGMPCDQILKKLHKDVRLLHKEVKKLKKQGQSCDWVLTLQGQMTDLIKYLKKHRLQHDVVVFHQAVHDRWGVLFDTVAKKQDIEPLLGSVGFETQGFEGLKKLVKKIEKDLRKIDEYEYRLHTDWIDAKLANYVLKIELIRLRNAAFFHPLYKGTKLQLPSSYPR